MTTPPVEITGIGSISSRGAVRGLAVGVSPAPVPIAAWPAQPRRRAFLVPPFRPGDVVPGLKTRRLDRFSVWCLVASALAALDAGLDLAAEDPARIAVVAGTGFGCLDLTEAFFGSIVRDGPARADPIVFPETLANCPASHVGRVLGLRGPNITLSARRTSGEEALLRGASLVRHGRADVAIALAGDVLTRPLHEWYECASLLSDEFVPGEGVAAVVLERAGHRATKHYGRLLRGASSGGRDFDAVIGNVVGGVPPRDLGLVITTGREMAAVRATLGPEVACVDGETLCGAFDGAGLLRLVLAVSRAPSAGNVLLAAGSAAAGAAAVLLEFRGEAAR